jgi:hypothetical protein
MGTTVVDEGVSGGSPPLPGPRRGRTRVPSCLGAPIRKARRGDALPTADLLGNAAINPCALAEIYIETLGEVVLRTPHDDPSSCRFCCES